MWMVIHMARSEKAARDIQALLSREGILVKIRPVYRNVPSSDNYYEIQVLGSEAREARQVLGEHNL